MTAMDLLELMGEAGDGYLQEAQCFRSGALRRPKRKLWLIAVLAAVTLLLVGCTVAYVQGWFPELFAKHSSQPLSEEQVQFLQDHEQAVGQKQTHDGWTVEVRSVLTDGAKGYVILGITAPEGQSLEPEAIQKLAKGNASGVSLKPGNLDRLGLFDLLQVPKGVASDTPGVVWEEDGDGRANTKNYLITFQTDPSLSDIDPFGPEAVYTLRIQDFLCTWTDEDAMQEAIAGQPYDPNIYTIEQEYVDRVFQKKTLAEGTWEFEICFAGKEEPESVELLTAPIVTQASIFITTEYRGFSLDRLGEATLTSFTLRSLSGRLTYECDQGVPDFVYDGQKIHAVMKDGSQIRLILGGGSGHLGKGFFNLVPETPILLSQLHYVQLTDGTRLYPDGQVQVPDRVTEPAVEAPTELLPGETTLEELCAYHHQEDVYGFRADLNGDGWEDLALWQDGAFRKLYLLDSQDRLIQEYPLNSSFDIYHTCQHHMEGNLCQPLIGFREQETCHIYQLREGALSFQTGYRREGETFFRATGEDSWEEIHFSEYDTIWRTYQPMYCLLVPIGVCD